MASIGFLSPQCEVNDRLRARVREAARYIAQGETGYGVTFLQSELDLVFAQALVDYGGTLRVVFPHHNVSRHVSREHFPLFEELSGAAEQIWTLPAATPSRVAIITATEFLVRVCEELYAVWDQATPGDIADTIQSAHAQRRRVHLLN